MNVGMNMVTRVGVGVAALLLMASTASATLYGFDRITANAPQNVEGQLWVDVTQSGGNVSFVFLNNGPIASSITDIYFDDSSLLGSIIAINDGAGVDFEVGASPGNLPGANNAVPAFETTLQLSADSNPPAQPNGVNPGENTQLIVSLLPGKTFNDVVADLASGALRIGIHVQGIGAESDSFVNTTTRVPDVAQTSVLLLAALAGLSTVRGLVRKN